MFHEAQTRTGSVVEIWHKVLAGIQYSTMGEYMAGKSDEGIIILFILNI